MTFFEELCSFFTCILARIWNALADLINGFFEEKPE